MKRATKLMHEPYESEIDILEAVADGSSTSVIRLAVTARQFLKLRARVQDKLERNGPTTLHNALRELLEGM